MLPSTWKLMTIEALYNGKAETQPFWEPFWRFALFRPRHWLNASLPLCVSPSIWIYYLWKSMNWICTLLDYPTMPGSIFSWKVTWDKAKWIRQMKKRVNSFLELIASGVLLCFLFTTQKWNIKNRMLFYQARQLALFGSSLVKLSLANAIARQWNASSLSQNK